MMPPRLPSPAAPQTEPDGERSEQPRRVVLARATRLPGFADRRVARALPSAGAAPGFVPDRRISAPAPARSLSRHGTHRVQHRDACPACCVPTQLAREQSSKHERGSGRGGENTEQDRTQEGVNAMQWNSESWPGRRQTKRREICSTRRGLSARAPLPASSAASRATPPTAPALPALPLQLPRTNRTNARQCLIACARAVAAARATVLPITDNRRPLRPLWSHGNGPRDVRADHTRGVGRPSHHAEVKVMFRYPTNFGNLDLRWTF